MTSVAQPSKRELLLSLLESGKVLVRLDARAEGVDLPPNLRDEAELGLNLSYRFAGPLAVEEEGVAATLSFSGEPYACYLPFGAVYAMVSHRTGEGFFFPADAPPSALEALAEALEERRGERGEPASPPPTPARGPDRERPPSREGRPPFLSLVKGDATEPPAPEPDLPSDDEGGTARPRLRLVE